MGEYLIQAGLLVDGTKNAALQNADVHVVGDTIRAVGVRGSIAVAPTVPVLNYTDRTLMPGLIDLHIHMAPTNTENEVTRSIESPDLRLIRSVKDARNLLHAGFTAARHVGGSDGISIRDAINEGEIEGPTMQASGLCISQTAGHGDMHFLPLEWMESERVRSGILADGVAACQRAVRRNLREGVDLIKIMTSGGVATQRDHPQWAQFSLEEVKTMCEEAARWERPVAAHAGGRAGITQAILGGVKTVEHGYFMDRETTELMAEHEVYLVPTLLRQEMGVNMGPAAGSSSWLNEKFKEVWEHSQKAVRWAYEAGVQIGLGTDMGLRPYTRHGNNWREAELLVAVGLSNLDAVRAGTQVAAQAMGLGREIGTVEVGKKADLITVDGNPLTDITALGRVTGVMKRGSVVR
jgi:imidazolonepropionase-like amidohydrolase